MPGKFPKYKHREVKESANKGKVRSVAGSTNTIRVFIYSI